VLFACVCITVVTSQIIDINSTFQVTVNIAAAVVCGKAAVALYTV